MGAVFEPMLVAACKDPAYDCVNTVAEMKVSCGEQSLPRANSINHTLLCAARDGDVHRLQDAIDSGAFLETRRPFRMLAETLEDPSGELTSVPGLTPLMYACKSGNIKCVQVLLNAGALVNAEDEDSMTALHFAAQCGEYDVFKVLMDAGGDASAVDASNMLPLDLLPDEIARDRKVFSMWKTAASSDAKPEWRKQPLQQSEAFGKTTTIITFDESYGGTLGLDKGERSCSHQAKNGHSWLAANSCVAADWISTGKW
jgi:ankyrin repeat protein|eukprot:TRINITY_DN64788_c0_g1_i1.p1 TRINITY_DN64788_c0_g1~~TRINITY_DN64788_c0_g1_i1.p1  ORF type:complete len:257 (-),score=34.53 TRINITY_DN64788_c0_g1_i1:240-1010(-)